jgi:hypothetical protein
MGAFAYTARSLFTYAVREFSLLYASEQGIVA